MNAVFSDMIFTVEHQEEYKDIYVPTSDTSLQLKDYRKTKAIEKPVFQ